MLIYAAIIEWPDNFGQSPTLILAGASAHREVRLKNELLNMADRVRDPEWREILRPVMEADPLVSLVDFKEWVEFNFADADEAPVITYYEEVQF